MDSQTKKTVIILDHGAYFSRPSGLTFNVNGQSIDQPSTAIDLSNNEQTIGMKSLWTCLVEAVLEYCRILYDIFEDDALISLIVTGIDQRDQSSYWNRYKNLTQCMDFFVGIQPPNENLNINENDLLKHSLNEAITALCTRSKKQIHPEDSDFSNDGHIVLFSSLNNDRLQSIERDLQTFQQSRNHMALEINDFVPLTNCELTLIDVRPIDQPVPKQEPIVHSISSILKRTIYYAQAGQNLFTRTLQVLLKQHNLSLTTVTGIPMKEDVASKASLNYDVDIVHPAEVHQALCERAPLKYWRQIKDDVETIVLKWSAITYDSENYYDTYSAYRFSPLDVNSRESACLTNFLLSGKCVLLEVGQVPNQSTIDLEKTLNESDLIGSDVDLNNSLCSSNQRLFSHMIISHNQQLMIHSIAFGSNNPLSKIPPIYMVNEENDSLTSIDFDEFDEIDEDSLEKDLCVDNFIKLIRTTTLYPLDSIVAGKIPIEDSLRLLERNTRRSPILSNETILFQINNPVHILTNLILRDKLSDEDLNKCLNALRHIDKMEQNNELLSVPSNFQYSTKVTTVKSRKEESYRYLWREIEYFVRAYKETSDGHRLIYQSIIDRNKIEFDRDSMIYPGNKIEFLFPVDENCSIVRQDKNRKRSSKTVEETIGRVWNEFNDIKQVISGHSLKEMWNQKQQEKRAPEFDGRMEYPPPRSIPLYINFNTKSSNSIIEKN